MASTPIVSRLEVNLGWKAWFKTFLVHPTVTAGAAVNMKDVAVFKEHQQRQKQLKLAKNQLKANVATLLLRISGKLEGNAVTTTQKNTIDSLSHLYSELDQVHHAWKIVHTIRDPALKADLRAFFVELEMDEYTLFEDIASKIKDPTALEDLEGIFASRNLRDMVDAVVGFVGEIEIEEGKDAKDAAALQEKIGAYRQKVRENSTLSVEALIPSKAPKELSVKPYVHPTHILQGAFLKTFGLDGFESTSTELVDGRGNQYSYVRTHADGKYPTVPFSLAFWTFLGFPTRLHDGKANLGLREIIRNLFGGWDSLNNGLSKSAQTWHWWAHWKNYTFEGKRLWNLILLPIKLVIFAVKVATLLLKFALNVLKLVTEFLPEVILNYSGDWFGRASSGLLLTHHAGINPLSTFFWGTGYALSFIVSAPIHYAARLLALVGTAATSPEKSARMAWNYGRALNSRFGYVFAFIGAAISIALTATLWAITFPLVFAKVLVLFPALAPIVTSIAQWPIVASTLAYINGAATLVAGTVPAAFSLAATALSTAFGVTVSAMTMAVATTLAIIVAPVVSIASRVMDGLSNLWTYWRASTPLLIGREETVARLTAVSLKTAFTFKSAPSSRAQGHTSGMYIQLDDADSAVRSADSAAKSAAKPAEVKPPYLAQTPNEPSPGIYCEPPRERQSQYVTIDTF